MSDSDILEGVQVDTLSDLIDLLVPPPEPAPVSMVPQTVGWVVLGVLLALGLAWVAWKRWRRWQANAYRRAALEELERAGDDPAAIAVILRRAALAAWPRGDVASLSGDDWLRFLDRTADAGFVGEPGSAIVTGPYRADGEPVPGLGALAAEWIRGHRVEAVP